jgi:DNA-binding NarL/FixJ family response regulator
LGEAAFADAWAEGAAMPVEDAIAEALAVAQPPPEPEPCLASNLTPRERDVLRLLMEGRSDREIAAELFISHRTVARHVTGIFTKLGVSNRTAAATLAMREDFGFRS